MTTNQAFIRAYTQGEATSEPLRPPHAPAPSIETIVHFVSPDEPACLATADPFLTCDGDPRQRRVDPLDEPYTEPYGQQAEDSAPRSSDPPSIHEQSSPFPARPESHPVAASTKRPLSAFVPHLAGETFPAATNNRAMFHWPMFCERLLQQTGTAFDQVAAVVNELLAEGRTLVGIAACYPQAGASTVALCTARRLAESGRSVALVDAHFARPQLAPMLGVRPTYYWQDMATHGMAINEVMVRSEGQSMALLSVAATAPGANQPIASLSAAATAGALRYAYDVVLLDMGPLLEPAHGTAVAQLAQAMRVDAALLVVDGARESATDIQRASQLLEGFGCPVVGAIENCVAADYSAAALNAS